MPCALSPSHPASPLRAPILNAPANTAPGPGCRTVRGGQLSFGIRRRLPHPAPDADTPDRTGAESRSRLRIA